MNSKRILEIQAERGAKPAGVEYMQKSIDFVISECRRFIQDRSDLYRDMAPENKRNTIRELIVSYVMSHPHLVEGYVDEENRPDTNKLVDKLVEDITDYGILTAAIMDPDVYEIRCNGKEIKIEKNGAIIDLVDKDNNIVSFKSVEQQDIVIRKLLGDTRLTPKDALVNARTVEGYRIAAVHSSAVAVDPDDPAAERYHAFVLRKFKKSKMGLPDIIKAGTISDNMGRLLALCPEGGLTFYTVGPTASGKTTTNNAILQAVPPDIRVVLVQNPTEITIYFKDASGRVINDVLHLEAKDMESLTLSDPTMVNIFNHVLRLSPTLVCFGELRSNIEFELGLIVMQAGHPINATFHAETSAGAIKRALTAVLAQMGNQPSHLALAEITDLVNIIVVQKKMKDGSRKVIQISEVVGVKKDNPNEPEINDLYIYDIDGDPIYDAQGRVKEVRGRHRRVGKLSDKTIAKLKLEAVSKSQYDFLMKPVDDKEVETYTGENIINYGKKLGE